MCADSVLREWAGLTAGLLGHVRDSVLRKVTPITSGKPDPRACPHVRKNTAAEGSCCLVQYLGKVWYEKTNWGVEPPGEDIRMLVEVASERVGKLNPYFVLVEFLKHGIGSGCSRVWSRDDRLVFERLKVLMEEWFQLRGIDVTDDFGCAAKLKG